LGMMGAGSFTAQAQTNAELQAQIASLLAQIQQLQAQLGTGTTATSTFSFNRSLTIGAQGADVTALQDYLISAGYSIPAGATGYFGVQTQAATAAWQAANGVSPAVGYFGPISQARYNSLMVAAAPDTGDADDTDDSADDSDDSDDSSDTSTPSTSLQGGEGYLDSEDFSLSSYDIDLGDTEVVYETEFEAKDSDVEINRVDFTFTDERPWLYFDEVNLLVDGQEVASLSDSSSNYTEVTNGWRARFSGLSEVVLEDDKVEITLEVVVKDVMQGTRSADTVDVIMEENAVRFVDGAGINDYAPAANFTAVDVTFNDTFSDGSIDVTLGNNSPEDATILLDADSDTNGVEVLEFDIEAEESDVEVNDVYVTFGVSNAFTTTTLGQLIDRTRLYADGSLVSTKSVATTSTTSVDVVFDDLDYEIDEDNVVTFTVEVDFNDVTETGDFPREFEAHLTQVDAETSDFSDASEASLTIGDGEFHTLVVEGLVDNVASVTAATISDGTVGEFVFELDVTAYGDTFYIDEDT
ncbi:MAG: peptidoglycan-binding protein, partial [Candidatus Paceibacterota bacterium]